jgi:transcriptional regulator with XRE-family HTH domain
MLTRTAERSRAAVLITGALRNSSTDAYALVDTLDAVTGAVLRTAGLDDATSRLVLAAMWEHPHPDAPASQNGRGIRLSDRDRELLRDLGARLRMVRRARRLSVPATARMTGISEFQLQDLEDGVAPPSAVALYRLADALRAPLSLLVDHRKAPWDVVVALARAEGMAIPDPAGEAEPAESPGRDEPGRPQ